MFLSLKMALRSIGANKMRSALTMLGIIIGVMALVVLVSLVNGATSSITDAVSGLGSSRLTLTVTDDKGKPVTLSDLDDWMGLDEVGTLSPYAAGSATAYRGGSSNTVTLYGVGQGYYEIEGLQLFMGRWIKAADVKNRSAVCILNESAAEKIVGYTDCAGAEIYLNGVKYTVIGVLANKDDSLTSQLLSTALTAYLPYSSLVRLTGTVSDKITTVYGSAAEGFTLEDAENAMSDIIAARFDEDGDAYSLSSQNVLEEAMNNINSVLTILLGGIAAISLIVGGIGIMNIMLVTVTERTREIGIRKAIGATRGTILLQFLMEAVVLCMMGCGLGIFISWAILQTLSAVVASLDMAFTLDGGVVLLSVVFCFVIGVIFGLYPANKAAKMKPIDALHYGG